MIPKISFFFFHFAWDLAKLDELDQFIYLHMDGGIPCPWLGEIFICTFHRPIHYLFLKWEVTLQIDGEKINDYGLCK